MELEAISELIKSVANEDFLVVAVLTFFLCEGIFSVWKKNEYKKITSIVVGAGLGYLVIGATAMGAILGGIAGGATTMAVARFTKK